MALSRVSKTVILVAVGILMAVMGLLSYIMFPRILKWQVEENLILSPEAEPYEFWRVIPVPIYSKFYFFNITNTKDILEHKAKPFVQELGPYTFRETREKVNITWHPNGTVSYFQIKRWYFEPSMTSGSLDDLITTVNVPLATAVNKGIRSGDTFYLNGVDAMAQHTKSTLYVTKNVRDLLFDGYDDEIFEAVKEMGIVVPYEKFGWFYAKNGSDDGEYTIFTGRNDLAQYGYVNLYKGSSVVPGRQPPCNSVGGTAGDMWPPFRNDKKEKLDLFVSDICSTLQLTYLSEVEVNEIESYRYWLDETAFDNGKHNEFNSCQCSDVCMPPGALDIETCQFDTPAVVSFPHFLYADQHYMDKIDGLTPDPAKHMFFIDLEPKLGIPVNVDARLQINVAIPNCDELENLELPDEKIFYPIFWFSESASINLETAEKLKFVTKMLPQYVTIGCFLSVACGGVIIIVVLHQTVRHIRQKPKKQMVYTAVRVVPQNFK
ncbi:protein croquemort [Parasteatoda tepidariorum]|uniref:protein croquemort n=1 Tax=Parasteatoda tepidariorum TaxID=114398 RepID=UPI00077FC5E8|nr:protein croquemort isoform X2 [Parasteatoda tepidariorum]XP_042910544.1 protein croquemort isoform X1 [Parasteatoda tepidariorum]